MKTQEEVFDYLKEEKREALSILENEKAISVLHYLREDNGAAIDDFRELLADVADDLMYDVPNGSPEWDQAQQLLALRRFLYQLKD